MPRDGSGIYEQPFENVETGTTIDSTVYNGFTRDVEADLNAARPVIAGGTGASNADQALFNLGGEKAAQLVTNYDSHIWVPGSFRSAAGATGAPTANAFAGVAYINEALANPPTNANVIVEARDLDDTETPGKLYVREKKAGVWGAWTLEGQAALDLKVNRAGDTMTGDLIIAPPISASLLLAAADTAGSANITGKQGALNRWRILLAANAAGDFWLARHDDAGVLSDLPLVFSRATGLGSVLANPTAALGIATKQYVDTHSFPSGTRLLFQQTAAPTGWVKETGFNDRALRQTSGSVGGSAGTKGFVSCFGQSATDIRTVTISEMTSHNHQPTQRSGGAGTQTGNDFTNGSVDTTSGARTGSEGGNTGHAHVMDIRVAYIDVIIAQKS